MLERRSVRKAPRRNVVAPRFDEDEELAARFAGRLRGPFLRAVGVLDAEAALWPRRVAAGSWNAFQAVDDLPWDGFRDALLPGVLSGLRAVFARAMEKELAENFDLSVRIAKIQPTDPSLAEALAFEYVQTHGAELVFLNEGVTRAGLRSILEKLVLENAPPAVLAKRMRESGLGLTPKWATAVENRRARLEALGKTPRQIDRQVESYRKRLLRARAQTIARTETIDARNAGIQSAWEVAVSEGELDPLMAKIWLAKVPCPICIELANHPPVPMKKPFVSPTIGPIMRPPAHPNCKCGIGLVDVDRGLGPSARRLREAAQADETPGGAETRRVAQEIQAEFLAASRARAPR